MGEAVRPNLHLSHSYYRYCFFKVAVNLGLTKSVVLILRVMHHPSAPAKTRGMEWEVSGASHTSSYCWVGPLVSHLGVTCELINLSVLRQQSWESNRNYTNLVQKYCSSSWQNSTLLYVSSRCPGCAMELPCLYWFPSVRRWSLLHEKPHYWKRNAHPWYFCAVATYGLKSRWNSSW